MFSDKVCKKIIECKTSTTKFTRPDINYPLMNIQAGVKSLKDHFNSYLELDTDETSFIEDDIIELMTWLYMLYEIIEQDKS